MKIRINGITMFLVYSSNILAVGYDTEKNEMYVLFKSGGLYAYEDVHITRFFDCFIKESIGNYIAREIKDHYNCRKVDFVSFSDFTSYIRQYIADE